MKAEHPLIRDLISDFQAKRWDSDPREKVLQLATSVPEEIAPLAQALMREVPEGGTFLSAGLAFLPETDWLPLIQTAVEYLSAASSNKAAESVLTHASFQCVQALHPFLTELFYLDSRFRTYDGAFAWRESGARHLEFLTRALHAEPSDPSATTSECDDVRMHAFAALLETRHPDALTSACEAAPALGLNLHQLRWNLFAVDCEQGEAGFRRLVPAKVRHLQFPAGSIDMPHYLKGRTFPSWEEAAPDAYRYRFGGVLDRVCGRCHSPLHHLLTIDPVWEGIGVTGLTGLSLATCLMCLGYEADWLFFQHDAEEIPSAYQPLETAQVPRFPSAPLQETLVAIVETPPRWQWQDWGLSSSGENLHRIGGHPCWVQQAEFPSCPCCKRTMPFLMQFDSNLPAADGGYLLWGSGGIAYIFWCDTCRISATMWQCT